MKLSELLKMEVVAENGRHLGRVVELRSTGEPEHGDTRGARLITELIYGKAGWLERLGFKCIEERRASWTQVVAIAEGKIVISEAKESD